LGAFADQPTVTASAKRETQAVEDDGLPRPGFPSENRQPPGERKIEVIDQNDVADRKSR
jgi:hypothetical protein